MKQTAKVEKPAKQMVTTTAGHDSANSQSSQKAAKGSRCRKHRGFEEQRRRGQTQPEKGASGRQGMTDARVDALQGTSMEAAFFDLDKTVIAKSSVLALGPSFYREGLVSLPTLIRSIYAQLVFVAVGADEERMERARRAASELSRGWDEETVRRLVNEALEDRLRPLLYTEALELFREHRRQGRRIFLVSSAPEEVVDPIARMLKVDDFVATRAEVVDGRYTGGVEFYCYGQNKAKAIQELAEARGIDLAASFAYSDSITDLPMLEAVGHPVAVNPDKELARVAEGRGWPILRFKHTIELEGERESFRFAGIRDEPMRRLLALGSLVVAGAVAARIVISWRSRQKA